MCWTSIRSSIPRFERAELDCIQCHVAASTTKGVPGVMLRSVFTSPIGHAGGRNARVHHRPREPAQGALGRLVRHREARQASAHGQRDLRAAGIAEAHRPITLDTTRYLTDTSDIVAHLVLAHQTQMHNLITQTNYQTAGLRAVQTSRHGQLSDAARQQFERPAEQLVRYLLFANEAPLEEPVEGGSGYAEEFAAKGSARFPGPFPARFRSAHAHFQVSVQLPDLLGGVRRHSGAGERVHLSPVVRSPERPRPESRVRVALRQRIAGRSSKFWSPPSQACRRSGSSSSSSQPQHERNTNAMRRHYREI